MVCCPNVLFTNALALHQITNHLVFQNKPNPEKHFSPHLVHQNRLMGR